VLKKFNNFSNEKVNICSFFEREGRRTRWRSETFRRDFYESFSNFAPSSRRGEKQEPLLMIIKLQMLMIMMHFLVVVVVV